MQQVSGLGMELWGGRQGLKCPCHEDKGWDGEALPALQARSVGATEPSRASLPAFPTGKVNPSTSWVPWLLWRGLAGQWMPFSSPGEEERLLSSSHSTCVQPGCDKPALSELQPVCFLLY